MVNSPTIAAQIGTSFKAKPRMHQGFTLVELLIVIIIIAILAAIAIPTYLEVRTKANDGATVTLVRNALTVVESAHIDKRDYSTITVADLGSIEPSIQWQAGAGDLVDPAIPVVTLAVTADAGNNEVDYYGQTSNIFDVAAVSESGNRFGIQVRTNAAGGTSYVKVKVIDGSSMLGW